MSRSISASTFTSSSTILDCDGQLYISLRVSSQRRPLEESSTLRFAVRFAKLVYRGLINYSVM
jgi:hypothetical protein